MIPGRRIVAVIIGLTLFQPSAALAEAVCDVHGTAPQETESPAHHSHGQVAPQTGDIVSAQESCHDVPPQTDCCQALASCGTELSAGATTRAGLLLVGEARHEGAVVSRPRSFLAAPEPPPPRI